MRAILALSALLIAIAVGWGRKSALEGRCGALSALKRDVRTLRERLELAPERLADMIGGLGCEYTASLWQRLAASLKEQRSIGELWQESIEAERRDGPLRRLLAGDANTIMGLGSALGLGARDAQIGRLRLLEKELEALYEEAEADHKRRGKLYSSMGILIGLALALMIV